MKISFNNVPLTVDYITDQQGCTAALNKLAESNLHIYGLDIETMKKHDPEHPRSGLCPLLSFPRLLQISTADTIYVFDTVKLGLCSADYASKPLKLAKTLPLPLIEFLQSRNFVAHNAVFEISHFTFNGIRNLKIDCSMVMSRTVFTAEHTQFEKTEEYEDTLPEEMDGLSRYRIKGHSLDDCIQRELGIRVDKTMQTSDWNKQHLAPAQVAYAALDAYLCRQLYHIYYPRLETLGLLKSYNVLKAQQHVIADMHIAGLRIDWDKHAKIVQRWTEEFEKAKQETKKYFGETNLASSKQMGQWLQKTMSKDVLAMWEKTEKGAYCFTRTKLTNFLHLPEIKALSEWKKYQKLLTTYGEGMLKHASPIDRRVRTSYSLGQTATARLSARDINIQNLPRDKEVREIFEAKKGNKLIVADFSQIEVRVQAELSRDPIMREAYAKKQDIYKVFASKLYHKPIDQIDKKQRSVSKQAILALAYGMGATKLRMYALNAGVDISQAEADQAYAGYHRTFRVYSSWCDEQRNKAKLRGYATTLLGKKRKLKEDEVYTRAPNHAVQGTAAELLFVASVLCRNLLDSRKISAKLVASVHDEVIIEATEECAEDAKSILRYSMCKAMQYLFPQASSYDVADANIGDNWAAAKG